MSGYTSAHLRVDHTDPAEIDRFERVFNAGRLCHQFALCPHPEPRPTEKILSSTSAAEKRVAWRLEHWGVLVDIGPHLFNSIENLGPSIPQLHIDVLDGDPGRFIAFLREQDSKVSRVRRAPSYRRGARIPLSSLMGAPMLSVTAGTTEIGVIDRISDRAVKALLVLPGGSKGPWVKR